MTVCVITFLPFIFQATALQNILRFSVSIPLWPMTQTTPNFYSPSTLFLPPFSLLSTPGPFHSTFSTLLPQIQLGSLGPSVVSSPSGLRGGAPATTAFLHISQNAPRGSIFQLPQHFLWRKMCHSPLRFRRRCPRWPNFMVLTLKWPSTGFSHVAQWHWL